MARATRLRVYEPEPPEVGGDQPTREAFPAAPPPIAPNSQHGDDVLAVLRRETDHAIAVAGQANSTATAAYEAAGRAITDTATLATGAATLAERTKQIEAQTAELGRKTFAALAEQQASNRQAGAVIATATSQIVALLAQIFAYALDRLPMLLTLAAAVWLWRQVLDDPTVLRLVGLGLFGALVIAPALWLSARRGASN